MRPRPIRRASQGIRSHTTRHLQANSAKHELYMRLTILEIERNRRESERSALLKRLASLDERLAKLAIEQDSVRRLLDDASAPSNAMPMESRPSDILPWKYGG